MGMDLYVDPLGAGNRVTEMRGDPFVRTFSKIYENEILALTGHIITLTAYLYSHQRSYATYRPHNDYFS